MVSTPLDGKHSLEVPAGIAIVGATATGKSALGVKLALTFGGEVISMDSRQVYRGMDVGTGKITPDEMQGVPHHLLDILDPHEVGSAGEHARLVGEIFDDIVDRGKLPILVGGTGFYLRAFEYGLIDVDIPAADRQQIQETLAGFSNEELHQQLANVDPVRADELEPEDRMRVMRALEVFQHTGKPASSWFATRSPQRKLFKIVLTMEREKLRSRIAHRTRELFDRGWIDEVCALQAAGYDEHAPGLDSLGYRDILLALKSGTAPQDCLDPIITSTRQYAKRQETFFRREVGALWIDVGRPGWYESLEYQVRERLGGFEAT